MSSRISISRQNGGALFYFEQLVSKIPLDSFSCCIAEYNDYLVKDALHSQSDHVALTWLLRERKTDAITAYMSLIADAIKLSISEKELHNLNYPFKTLPAMKIAKLAVSQHAKEQYKGLGTYMINEGYQYRRASAT